MNKQNAYNCIYSGEKITEENNSKAHIFPNAIGGRLKPKNLLTKQSNGGNLKKIEDDFIDPFKELLSLIDPIRDRKVAPRHHYTSELKEKYMQSRGGAFLEHVKSGEKKPGDQYKNHIIIFGSNPKIKRVQTFDFEKIIPALYVFSTIFAAYKGKPINKTFKTFVDNPKLIIRSAGIHLCSLSKRISRNENSICHTIAIGQHKNKKATYVYIEIFGIIAALTYLPYTENIASCGYSIDITKGTSHEFSISNDFFSDLNFIETDKYTETVVTPSMYTLLLTIRNLQLNRYTGEVFKEVFSGGLHNHDINSRLNNAYELIEKTYRNLKDPFFIKDTTSLPT